MKKLFDKSEIAFAIMLIVVYVVGESLMQRVSATVGVTFLAEVIFNTVMAVIILIFARKSGLMKHLGLCKPATSAGKALFYIPLLLLGTQCVFLGINTEISALDLTLRTLMMFGVGSLEEIIFRGFLFRGIEKTTTVKEAVIISSITFGVGHIVNLFNGYDITQSIIQIVCAVSLGFMLMLIRVRTGSLIVCIIFHGVFNSMSALCSHKILVDAVGSKLTADFILAVSYIIISLAYTIYLFKALPKRELTD